RPSLCIVDCILHVTPIAARHRHRRESRRELILFALLHRRGRRRRRRTVAEQSADGSDDSRLSVERERRVDSLTERLEPRGIALRITLEQRVRAVEAEAWQQIRRCAVREGVRRKPGAMRFPGALEIPRRCGEVQSQQLYLAPFVRRSGVGAHLRYENLCEAERDLLLRHTPEKT